MALRRVGGWPGPSHRFRPPDPHPSGAVAPAIPAEFVPRHVALVMDGNGRWAQDRGLPRTEGHKRGEAVLMDAVCGCIELGVGWLSAYAFSTENWSRSPDEVKFLMGFNRDVIRRRRDEMNEMGVRVRWAGRRPRLWRSVIRELEVAEELTKDNTVMTLTMCVNYGGALKLLMRQGKSPGVRRAARSIRNGSPRHRSQNISTARHAGCRPVPAAVRGSGSPTSCCGSRRTPKWCTRRSCSRLRPARPVGRMPGVRRTRPSFRGVKKRPARRQRI